MKAPCPGRLRAASILLLLLLPIATGCPSPEGPSQGGIRSVTQQELLSLSEDPTSVVILDVRSESEFASGHVPGALNIPHDQLVDRLDEIDGDREKGVIV
jgi:phage shock protein E